ncbi:hypothetical protein BDQ12DRAFT_764147 [Crucibulum laeve]|uniref:Uncharacterized protein n=1 Tax=Crucibulum laeve TaxID=68775 RepID=A0A5C3LZK8_9AGAR|nr:hypothetical protein BDQ12DRAFT_764147 [Crucibulum laeve]
MITAVTNEVGMILPDIHPIYPFDAYKIPTDTATHLKTIQRESPLVTIGISEAFQRSRSFALNIHSILSEGSERSISAVTVVRSRQLTSLQCLKEDDKEPDELLPQLFERVLIAEMYALNEAFAYNKLRPAQGTVIPWFYGIHQFTLPNGTVLYGLLMEYIEGSVLDSNFTQELSPSRQIKMREKLTKRNPLRSKVVITPPAFWMSPTSANATGIQGKYFFTQIKQPRLTMLS